MSIFSTKILSAVDGSQESLLAARMAVELAKSSDSELHVVYVEPVEHAYHFADWKAYPPDLPDQLSRMAHEKAQGQLDEQMQKISGEEHVVAVGHARVGRPDIVILELAEEVDAGLIVMGSRGLGGLKRALMGSISDAVVRHAHCPVLIARSMEKD